MTWEVVFSDASKKFLKKLRDAALLDRLLAATTKLASDPRPSGCRKLAGTDDRYRIRVGNYRIIYRIDDGRVTVLVLVIGHRREVYG
ncbi:MAG: type II toxin-antitoxin system RelE/ParE family toxin [Chthoniobacterales bacterium]|nr:type II toxin-antitoxin system RelE/ParE family toxin [Chthoniobacterales bacterium]